MNTLKNYYYILSLVFIVFQSCDSSSSDSDPTPAPTYDHFVSLDEAVNVSKLFVEFGAVEAGFEDFTDYIKYGVNLHQITYKTTYKGSEVTASGLLSIPDTDDALPLSMIHRGTIFSDQEAPSKNKLSGVYGLYGALGYISFTPDMLGFGSTKSILHPYYNYEYTGQTSIDMLKAVIEYLDNNNINYINDLYIAGYSQGGYSSVATLKYIEENNVNTGVDVIGVAAGAGGYDIKNVMEEILSEDTYPSPAYLSFVIQSYNVTNDWNNDESYYFKAPYAGTVTGLLDANKSQSQVNSALTTNLVNLFTESFLTDLREGTETQFITALTNNSVSDWTPQTPIRFYHSQNDEVVPYSNSVATVNTMKANGASDVEMIETQGSDHAEGAAYMILEALTWMKGLEAEVQ